MIFRKAAEFGGAETEPQKPVVVTDTKNRQELTTCKGFPKGKQINPEDLTIIVDKNRYKFLTGFGFSYWYHNEEDGSNVELYRANASKPFVVRIPSEDN